MNPILQTREIDQIKFSYVNEEEFLALYRGIFAFHEYKFTSDTSAPFIIDCGAHIGMSVLYFKRMYPKAKIVAFEPNPNSFKLLERNITQNNLKDVTIINAAIAPLAGKIDFYVAADKSENFETWAWSFSGVKNAWYD